MVIKFLWWGLKGFRRYNLATPNLFPKPGGQIRNEFTVHSVGIHKSGHKIATDQINVIQRCLTSEEQLVY